MFEYMILDLLCLLRAMVVYTYNVHSTPGIYWSIVEHHDRTSLLPAMRTNYYCLTRNRKVRARKKKRQIQKAKKAPGILPTTDPWREKEWAGKTKKKTPISSLLLSSSWNFFFYFFLFLVCGFQGIACWWWCQWRATQDNTQQRALPFSFLFWRPLSFSNFGDSQTIDRSIDRPIEMDSCLLAVPLSLLILQGFQSVSASQKQDQVKQSCFKSSCLCPHLLTPPPPSPYKNISHIHFWL